MADGLRDTHPRAHTHTCTHTHTHTHTHTCRYTHTPPGRAESDPSRAAMHLRRGDEARLSPRAAPSVAGYLRQAVTGPVRLPSVEGGWGVFSRNRRDAVRPPKVAGPSEPVLAVLGLNFLTSRPLLVAAGAALTPHTRGPARLSVLTVNQTWHLSLPTARAVVALFCNRAPDHVLYSAPVTLKSYLMKAR